MKRKTERGWIDFHAHILPGADHGSGSLAESLEQLTLLSGAGIDAVVAAPHFYPTIHTVPAFVNMRDKCAHILADACQGSGLPQVYVGAEVYMCEGLDRLDGIEKLAIQGTNVILLEMPENDVWSSELLATLMRIRDERQMHPVIVHPDRYLLTQVSKLLVAGFDVQLNAVGFTGRGKKITNCCLDAGNAVAIGTDQHGTGTHNVKAFVRALARLHDARYSLTESSRKLLRGAIPLRG